MRRLRLSCAALCAWLFLFYNTERLHEPINLASFVYLFAAVAGMLVILFGRIQRIPLVWLLTLPIPLVLLLKMWLGYRIGGANLPITITELGAVWITIVLARQIGRSLEEFRNALATTVVSHLNDRSRPFEDGQEELYREIRRARRYDRPLSLLAIAPCDDATSVSLDSLTKELHRDMLGPYIMARISDFLSAETRDCSIITRRNGHFLTLLPETDRQEATTLVETLERSAKEKLGLQLKIGLSTFPEEEVTFISLLESAETQMGKRGKAKSGAKSNGRPTNGRARAHNSLDQDGRKGGAEVIKIEPHRKTTEDTVGQQNI